MASIKLLHVNSFVDRYGKVRRYFRRRGHKAIRLPGLPGSEAFMAAYSAALGGVPDKVSEIGCKPDAARHHQRADRVLLQVGGVAATGAGNAQDALPHHRALPGAAWRQAGRAATPRARRDHASGDQRALGETALAEDDPRAVAVRDPEHDQGQSG